MKTSFKVGSIKVKVYTYVDGYESLPIDNRLIQPIESGVRTNPMNIEDIKVSSYKYKISKFEIIMPNGQPPIKLDEAHIGNFTIEKDFENMVFPFLEFRVMVTDAEYQKIIKESENVYVDVKIEYCHMEQPYEDEPEQVHNMDGTLFDTRFYAFLTDNSPKLTSQSLAEENKEKLAAGDITQYQYDDQKEMIMMLYRADHIFNTNQIVNDPLAKVTITDCMVYLFKRVGLNKIMFSPATNGEMYSQMIMTPVPVISSLFRMIMTYGLHKDGTTLFFDSDYIYVVNKALGCTVWRTNEHKIVYLASFPNAGGDNAVVRSGFYSNDQEKYDLINLSANQISLVNNSMYDDQFKGGNIAVIDSTTTAIETVRTPMKVSDMSPSKSGKINQIVVKDSGSSQGQAISTGIKYDQRTISINVEDINIAALVPNRDFILTTDNTDHKDACGHYKIISMGATFTKESELYKVAVQASFVGGQSSTWFRLSIIIKCLSENTPIEKELVQVLTTRLYRPKRFVNKVTSSFLSAHIFFTEGPGAT